MVIIKKVKRLLSVVVIFTMMISVLIAGGGATSVSAEENKEVEMAELEAKDAELQKQIEALEDQKEEEEKLKAALEEKIQNTIEKINLYSGEIEELNVQIEEKNREIEKRQQDLLDQKEEFKLRLRAMYMSGNNTDLSVLLSAKDFGDFLTKSELIRSVSEQDKQLMDNITSSITAIEAKKQEITDSNAELIRLNDELKAEKLNLDDQYADVNTVIAKINSDTAKAEQERADVAAARADLERQIAAALAGSANTATGQNGGSTGQLRWPLPGYWSISTYFGWREWTNSFHKGIDITGGGVFGAGITAADGGQVLISQWHGSYGYYVLIDHGNNMATLYAHCSELLVTAGQTVSKGDTIAKVGSTGFSTGPHLHFEVWVNGEAVDPFGYV